MPRVSVILNCYNQAEYLEEAVDSVVRQSFRDFELIITDNGSTDKTPEILQKYRDPRIRLTLHKENASISRRFNEAIARAEGEYVSFLYSDDLYLEDKLARQVQIFDALPEDYGVVYAPPIVLNQISGASWKGTTYTESGFIFRCMCEEFEKGHVNMVSPMTRRRCLVENPFLETVFAECEAIFFRLALRYKFHYDGEPGAICRDHERNAGKALRVNSEMMMVVLDDLERQPEVTAEKRLLIKNYRAAILRNCGWSTVRSNGEPRWARQVLLRSVKLNPRNAFHPRVLAGIVLGIVPPLIRKWLNRLGNRLRGVRHNSVYVESYQ